MTIFHILAIVGFALGFVALYYMDKAAELSEVMLFIFCNSYPDEVAPSDYNRMRDVHKCAESAIPREARRWRPCPDRHAAVIAYRKRQAELAAECGGLGFKRACQWLAQGLSVRCSSWPPGRFIAFAPAGPSIVNAELRMWLGDRNAVDSMPYCPDDVAVKALDWFPVVDANEAVTP